MVQEHIESGCFIQVLAEVTNFSGYYLTPAARDPPAFALLIDALGHDRTKGPILTRGVLAFTRTRRTGYERHRLF